MKKSILTLLLLIFAFMLSAGTPKYVFLMIGDGMGPGTVQMYNKLFPDNNLKKFAAPVLTGTNNVFGKTTDSAASGTALACGIKTYNKSIAMDKDGKPVTSLAKLLKKRQWKIGIVSSVGINDATPATHYANRKTRNEYAGIISDIGRPGFDFFGVSLIKGNAKAGMAQLKKVLSSSKYQIVNGKNMNKLKPENKNAVITGTNVPQLKPGSVRLCDITTKAAELLSAGDNRFFLMVEGGAVDHGNHANDASWAMKEMIEFDAAIGAALNFAAKHPEDTLIIVTADHDTGGLTLKDPSKLDSKFYLKQKTFLAGLTSVAVKLKAAKLPADQIIKQLTRQVGIENITADEQKKLNYACSLFLDGKTTSTDKFTAGMGYGRYNPLVIEVLRTRDRRNGFYYTSFGHTNAKVTTFVKGPGSEHFKAPLENSDIPHRIAAAAGMPELLKKEGKAAAKSAR